MSTSGKSETGRPIAGRLASASAAQFTRATPPFGGQASIAGVVASTVGKRSVPAVFVRIYHGKKTEKTEKTDQVPQKLSKKCPASELKASISAPLPVQWPAVPTPSRAFSTQPRPSSQAKMSPVAPQKMPAVAGRNVVTTDGACASNSSRRSVTISPPHVSPLPLQRTAPPRSTQVRPAIPSSVPAKNSDTAARRSASSTSLDRPSGTLSPSTSSASKPQWPWAPHPNPLRSNPPLALTVSPRPVSHLPVAKIMGKYYNRRLSRMTILPTLLESTDEDLLPAPVPMKIQAPRPQPITIIAVRPGCAPRPAAPLNLPTAQRSQTQQLKARNDLVEAVNDLKTENTHLSSALQDAISQRIVAVTQLEQQKKDNLALEASLKALWALVSPNVGLADVSSTARIQEQVQLFSAASSSIMPKYQQQQQHTHTAAALAQELKLKQKLAQQTQQAAFYRRRDAASRQMADALVIENQQVMAGLHQAEAERSRLRMSLDAAEGKLERIERSLYIIPALTAPGMAETGGLTSLLKG